MITDLFFSRSMISGLLGGALAIWFCAKFSSLLPQICRGKNREILLSENRISILCANGIFFFGICSSIYLYQSHFFLNSDWRGFAFGAGGGCLGMILVIPVQAMINGRSYVEAYVAYAISQKTPVFLLYILTVSGIGAFFAALGTLII